MEEKRMNDERLAQLIRAAARRRKTPVGLETRIMARIVVQERRRRELRAIAAMACCCMIASVAVVVVAFAGLRSADLSEGVLHVAATLAGIVAAAVIACGDRAAEILRRL